MGCLSDRSRDLFLKVMGGGLGREFCRFQCYIFIFVIFDFRDFGIGPCFIDGWAFGGCGGMG